eukprot:CAMPEP_0194746084 /NCGR_PEP_ID=MMETSP0296-20130528/101756_1 /TAXON_ID=39354 /ORGANISM="Heterosigma akashiwo, Strain CCMP2393" /LENGTH=58 /DNA_ID=CAMNT_0039658357 /DNA_START=507 /DNA_END=683 /DNA_ORIENTATION=-
MYNIISGSRKIKKQGKVDIAMSGAPAPVDVSSLLLRTTDCAPSVAANQPALLLGGKGP